VAAIGFAEDGWIDFDSQLSAGGFWNLFGSLPSPSEPLNMLAVSWTDLAGGTWWWGVSGPTGARVAVVSFNQFAQVPPPNQPAATAWESQVQLVEATGVIEVHFTNVVSTPGYPGTTIGLQNEDGTLGTVYVNDSIALNEVNTAVAFHPYEMSEADYDGDTFIACLECDDTNADVSPAEPELCGDGVDNDCNGQVDEAGCTPP